MPGKSFSGNFEPLNTEEEISKEELKAHLTELSVNIQSRFIGTIGHEQSARYIESSLRKSGYEPVSQSFSVGDISLRNIEATVPGNKNPEKTIIVGAHYDTVAGTPGADDNASGVAALLHLARLFKQTPTGLTLKFVAFSNEETVFYSSMGSYFYAQRCFEQQENIAGMYSLEMLGCYSTREKSQAYPEPLNLFYPTIGNFIAFVGNNKARVFLKDSIRSFRRNCNFPSEGCAAPDWLSDANRSDHCSFWRFGYPAIMVTDTSNFRNRNYHGPQDSLLTLDLNSMSRVVRGLERMIREIAKS